MNKEDVILKILLDANCDVSENVPEFKMLSPSNGTFFFSVKLSETRTVDVISNRQTTAEVLDMMEQIKKIQNR
jgi:hypothetical protein